MILIYIVFLGLSVIYLYVILLFKKGWNKIEPYRDTQPDHGKYIFVSVIVVLRNEEDNFYELIGSIKNQNYPKSFFEVILVNDHSNDDTLKLIQKTCHEDSLFRYIDLEEESGKKAGISIAAKRARGDLFLFTDADCIHSSNWISVFVNYYNVYQPYLISSVLLIRTPSNLWEIFQYLDFAGLVFCGAGAIGIGKPIMNNGANMAVKRSVFFKVMNDIKEEFASGDDIFLLLGIKSRWPKKIHFIKSQKTIVYTKPVHTLKEFYHQRLRWTSKSKEYRDKQLIGTAIVVYSINLCIVVSAAGSFFYESFLYLFCSVFLLKCITDIIFFSSILKQFNKKYFLPLVIPFNIVYSLYIVTVGAVGNFTCFSWKGRKYSGK